MKYNNYYNFKNPIRHFINIDDLDYPADVATVGTKILSWTSPIPFRVRKELNSFRTLKLPNVLMFAASYEKFKNNSFFNDITKMDPGHKRLVANPNIGEFGIGSFERCLENDYRMLCIYDVLIKLDIKEFYGRLYTHKLQYENVDEHFLTNLNDGATNGLIMGNYISLYFAEQQLAELSNIIQSEIKGKEIRCEFTYFSDDFYFFCNQHDREDIIAIFDRALERFGLERNDKKVETWEYSTYNDYNVVERYWKKIISECKLPRYPAKNKRLIFINQLIYRSSRLTDFKQKRTLVTGFFKTSYFRTETDLREYAFKPYDLNQLCFLMREYPELLLYAADKLHDVNNFKKENFAKFFDIRYEEILKQPYQEEQLYFYYVMKLWGLSNILRRKKELVLKSENQVLISYYLLNGWFSKKQIDELKLEKNEDKWFQSYHLILCDNSLRSNLDTSIDLYLIPEAAKQNARAYFKEFYKTNITNEKSMLRDVKDVCGEIHDYLDIRFNEGMRLYGISV